MTVPMAIVHAVGLAFLLFLSGCVTLPLSSTHRDLSVKGERSLAAEVQALGEGLRFMNAPPLEGAATPEEGADYVYARTYSANARLSPVGIEVWTLGEGGAPLHQAHEAYLRRVYDEIYGWDPSAWKTELGEGEGSAEILRAKSDFFWELLAQQLAERVFNQGITPALYRFGPACRDAALPSCQDEGLPAVQRVVVRTYLDARRDPMNPVTRSITYTATKEALSDPELTFELQVPNGLRIAGPHEELLDFRPKVEGRQDALGDIRLWAHLPQGRSVRTKNVDYPDYNLLFVPLRHLVFQGEVADPTQPASGLDYPDKEALIAAVHALVNELRTAPGGRAVVERIRSFLSPTYYYMFEAGGQGLAGYRDYILGESAGIARGLNPDFGRVELMVDGALVGAFSEPQGP